MGDVLLLSDLGDRGWRELAGLLGSYGLRLELLDGSATIPGSYWGAPEAGLIASSVYARPDTPLHSVLHESCHFLCMDERRRGRLHTDAGGDDLEESAVCYLQLTLAGRLDGVAPSRIASDMDTWGYSFRLGSTSAWLSSDSEDARRWLVEHGLLDAEGRLTGQPRR